MLYSLVLFLIIMSKIDHCHAVRIIGFFPEHEKPPLHCSTGKNNVDWLNQSFAMFRAAIALAKHYKIYVDGKPIDQTILQTNTHGNGFTALEFLCQSITNSTESNVVGIVGPATSTNARFLGPLAAHIELPLVSYAATNAELDDIFIYKTFYRIAPSDILLAEAIVQLFENFSWTTCTMIFGKDDYGYGGLKILSEVYHTKVSIKQRLIFNPQLDQFHADLKQTVAKSRSRIILVWADRILSTRIIQHALDAKLFDESYVWLMTDKVNLV